MKKQILVVIVLLLSVLLLTAIAHTQTESSTVELYTDGPVRISVNGTVVHDSFPADPTATPTVVLPTVTSTTEPTVEPTSTPTPEPGTNIEPYAAAPLCESHDDTQTHTLWNAALGCHYDHSHGATPQDLENFFVKYGLPLADLENDTLGLSYQTTDENVYKHAGYTWLLYEVEGDGCYKEDKGLIDRFGSVDACIIAFAARLHDMGGSRASLTKLHSADLYTVACPDADASLEVDVPDLNNCGWAHAPSILAFGEDDLHEVHAPYKVEFLPGFEGDGNLHSPPYVGTRTEQECLGASAIGQDCLVTWNSERIDYVRTLDFRTYDDWHGTNTTDPLTANLLGGKYNASERHLYNLITTFPGEGILTETGQVPACLYADEAPCQQTFEYELNNYPAGNSAYIRVGGPRGQEGAQIQDDDIYFDGQSSGWIVFGE